MDPDELRRQFEQSELNRMMDHNSQYIGDRQVIVKFKKGGRIHEEHVYDSAHADMQTQMAIFTVLLISSRKNENGKPKIEIGPQMIGKGYMGLPPWENMQDHWKKHGHNFEKPAPDFEKDQFDFGTPMRVADVIEQPNGTVLVSIESS